MKLQHLLAWIAREPWAIEPRKAHEILAYLAARVAAGGDAEESAERIHPSRERAIREREGAVAVVALHGTMAQRRLPGASTGGGASTEAVGRELEKAAADTGVKAIILHIDSPGGSVYGTRELAAKVNAAKAIKPVIAQVDSLAASAAYWVASQATEVVVTPGGEVGSIGVIAVHEDLSGALEAEGIRPTIISAGKYKAEFSPYGPLGEEARAHLQARVDESHRDFVNAVAQGRGTKPSTVEADYGEGRTLHARAALSAGMVDRIATFDETLARFTRPASTQRRALAAQAIVRSSES